MKGNFARKFPVNVELLCKDLISLSFTVESQYLYSKMSKKMEEIVGWVVEEIDVLV